MDDIHLLKDRLVSARYAYLSSKTEEEIKTFRQLIKYLERQIRHVEVGELAEEVLD